MGEKTTTKTEGFVHLHNHTQYSLLDGLTKVGPLVETVKTMGMDAVAITDHGTLSGAIEFYKAAKEDDIKPIIGIETYVAPRGHTDKDPTKDKTPFHLILLAMNNKGYQNIMRLSTIANLEGFYYKPRIDHELLEKYNEGVIVLSACIGGEIGDALRQNQYEKAKETALWYKSVFGDRYYLEVQDHGHPDHPGVWDEQVGVNEKIFQLAKELKISTVVTCDAHYLRRKDQEAHEILLCVQTGSYLTDEKRMSLKDFELHVTNPGEVIARWGKDHPEVIENTVAIAKRCDVQIELGRILIPKFPLPQGQTEKSYLEKLVYQGLAWRYGEKSEKTVAKLEKKAAQATLSEDILKRAEYELGVIEDMGFNGYFLIISDFVNWGKDQGIVFGPGRGSAAGSIIAYSLKITELDPLKYDLLFERFLNPDRISMPDIDIDIQDSRRDEVIQYCVQKYGTNRVANIVTFGRMAARNAIRDVARVLQVPYADADRLSKMVPPPIQGRHTPLEQSIKTNPELRQEYETNEQSHRVFDLAVQLEGTIRSHGVHAAGVVIAPEDIVLYAPLEMAQKGVVATQYSMNPIEDLGLLKMDFLGLSNLTIIKNTLRIIKRVYEKDIDINTLPLNDQKTFELLRRGDTTGVFQFESSGMKRYLKELKPTVFNDIIAMGALYRPGPLTAGLTQKFIDRKNGKEEIAYDHPTMENALKDTYGVLVYQEQVMQIARDMCGFTGGQADTLRKAIGKKNRVVMDKMKKEFIKGAQDHVNASEELVLRFWKSLEGFADYAFNKSHSACYGLISYQTAYLKAHYPEAFMAALMTSDYDNTDRLAIEISECKNMGIEVQSPDVNESFLEFAIVPNAKQIRFGMSAIKNVGTGAVEEILRARDEGKFTSLDDFFARVSTRIVNRKALESLIKAGAFDSFENRSVLLNNLDVVLAYASRLQKQLASGQTDLFGNEVSEVMQAPRLVLDSSGDEYSPAEQLQWERDLLGIYLSQHPLEHYEIMLQDQTTPIKDITVERDGKTAKIGGIIADIREITTKSGQKMAFIKINDTDGEIELLLFPNSYQQTAHVWERDRIVIVKGKVTAKDKEGNLTSDIKLLVNEAREVSYAEAQNYKPRAKKAAKNDAGKPMPAAVANLRVYIRLADSQNQDMLMSLKQTIDQYQGTTEVVLVLGEASKKQIIKLPMKIHNTNESLGRLQTLVGADNVKVQ
jgi:DNA polymerase-3 subunit alpha